MSVDRGLDNTLLAQGCDLFDAYAEPGAQHILHMLAEKRRRLDLRRRTVEAHGPSGHLDPARRRVSNRLHDAAFLERRIVHELERVEHRAGWHAGRAEQLHRLFLVVLPGPGGDDLVDLGPALAARSLRIVPLIPAQVFSTDDLEQTLPVLGIGPAAEDVDVVVRPTRLAG